MFEIPAYESPGDDDWHAIEEAYSHRMMGSSLHVEDQTNPVVLYRCLSCDVKRFQRMYEPWPSHCFNEPMKAKGQLRSKDVERFKDFSMISPSRFGLTPARKGS